MINYNNIFVKIAEYNEICKKQYIEHMTELHPNFNENIGTLISYDSSEQILKWVPCVDNTPIPEEILILPIRILITRCWPTDGITDDLLRNHPEIEELDLEYNKVITDIGLSYLPNLKKISLPYCSITDNGCKYLVNCSEINLMNSPITDDGLLYFRNVKKLNLTGNENVTDIGLQYVNNVEHLYMASNLNITDKGLANLHKIKTLYLCYNTNITDYGLKCIDTIESLEMRHNKNISGSGLLPLKQLKSAWLGNSGKFKREEIIATKCPWLIIDNENVRINLGSVY